MSKSKTLITSRDPKGLQAVTIFEAAYNKAKLDDESAQLLNERGDELKAGVRDLIAKLAITSQFVHEEVKSTEGYLSGYSKPRRLAEQVKILRTLFSDIGEYDLVFGENELPEGAEGYFAIPRWQNFGKTYSEALQNVLDALSKAYGGKFKNWCEGQLGPNSLRQSATSSICWENIGLEQTGDILIVAGQFGIRHRGRSCRRALAVMRKSEFGLGAFAVGIMLLTHMDRLQNVDDLSIDCAGDESARVLQDSRGLFGLAPYFSYRSEGLSFGRRQVHVTDYDCSTASGFLIR